ncbi:MAG TPA: ATP-binding protein, partial [Polyangiales bacterium]|nr:ATP-binding protein [Polyangiales bacterium]
LQPSADVSGWRIAVSDQGSGVRAEDATRIFEPFFRSSSEGARNEGGAGLGLAIAREIARGVGGEVELLDSGGSGACFSLTLPYAR